MTAAPLVPTAALRRARTAARRGGGVLLPITWVLLGVALVGYVVGMLALAFLAVLVATLRLLLTPALTWLGRARAGAGGSATPRSLAG